MHVAEIVDVGNVAARSVSAPGFEFCADVICPVGKMALDLGLKGPSMNYVPNTPKVLHHSKLMLPGSSETLYFIAPDKPGDYMYVCSFPGHYLSMRGILRVMP